MTHLGVQFHLPSGFVLQHILPLPSNIVPCIPSCIITPNVKNGMSPQLYYIYMVYKPLKNAMYPQYSPVIYGL